MYEYPPGYVSLVDNNRHDLVAKSWITYYLLNTYPCQTPHWFWLFLQCRRNPLWTCMSLTNGLLLRSSTCMSGNNGAFVNELGWIFVWMILNSYSNSHLYSSVSKYTTILKFFSAYMNYFLSIPTTLPLTKVGPPILSGLCEGCLSITNMSMTSDWIFVWLISNPYRNSLLLL